MKIKKKNEANRHLTPEMTHTDNTQLLDFPPRSGTAGAEVKSRRPRVGSYVILDIANASLGAL